MWETSGQNDATLQSNENYKSSEFERTSNLEKGTASQHLWQIILRETMFMKQCSSHLERFPPRLHLTEWYTVSPGTVYTEINGLNVVKARHRWMSRRDVWCTLRKSKKENRKYLKEFMLYGRYKVSLGLKWAQKE